MVTAKKLPTVQQSINGSVSVRAATRTELVNAQATTMKKASAKKRNEAMNRDIVCNYISELMATTTTLTSAVDLLLSRAAINNLPRHIDVALRDCAKGSSVYPSRSRLCDWHKKSREGGVDALIPQNKGRVRQEGGWEALAIKLYNQPSKPTSASVYRILFEQHGFMFLSYAQVNNFLNALPAQLGKKSAGRIGTNLHRLTQQAFVRRTTENLKAGDIYVADGYRADIYLAHPVTGDIFRPEMTVAIDLRSRYVVGYRLDEHEGGFVVQSMWAETFAKHNHVPPLLYIDNGSGYKNSFMDAEVMGFYDRAGVVQIIHSLPGNPHGKGWVERFFRTMKDDFLKNWMPQFYCGHDMAAEEQNKTVTEVKRLLRERKKNFDAQGLSAPSVAQFIDALNAWLERYHARPHPEDKTTTKAQLWSGLVAIPPALSELELKRQQIKLKVRRAMVTHGKLDYKHENLYAFNGQEVILEFDMMDNNIGIIRTPEGIWICDAYLTAPIDVVPVNRLEAKRTQRASDAVKRLQKKMDEQVARSGVVIDAEAVLDGIGIEAPATQEDEIILDLLGN